MQILVEKIAKLKGINPDMPRNLAKTVTVWSRLLLSSNNHLLSMIVDINTTFIWYILFLLFHFILLKTFRIKFKFILGKESYSKFEINFRNLGMLLLTLFLDLFLKAKILYLNKLSI